MDPITACANVITAVCNMVTELVKGQTPEQKAQAWTWFQEDAARWRKLFKLD